MRKLIALAALAACHGDGGSDDGGPEPKRWREARALHDTAPASDALQPDVAIDADGRAVAAWTESDDLWACRFDPVIGWTEPQVIDSLPDSARNPRVAMSSQGAATVVWEQGAQIRASRYSAGWSAPETISKSEFAYGAQVIAAEEILAVWSDWRGSRYDVWFNRCRDGQWSGPEPLATAASNVSLARGPAGTAFAVWERDDGSIGWARWTSGWQVGTVPGFGFGSYTPNVAVDLLGNAVVVWTQIDVMTMSIVANRYEPGTGWGEATFIEGEIGSATDPRVSFDGAGRAIAVWAQQENYIGRIFANRLDAGTGWETPRRLDSAGENAFQPRVASSTVLWLTPTRVLADDERLDGLDRWTTGAALAVAPSGAAVAVWSQHDGAAYRIYASHYR